MIYIVRVTPARLHSSVKRRGNALRKNSAVPDVCKMSRM